MKSIVVGYDESPAADRALERAADFVKAFDAKLAVTSVAPVLLTAGRSAGPTDSADSIADHRRELRHAAEKLGPLAAVTDFVEAVGEPAHAIVEVAKERSADLIVVGTREPGLVERLLGQSVSEGVTRRAHCDVLIVH